MSEALKPGQQVTVLRSDGTLEDDWYLWTDTNHPNFVFTAPELIGCLVIKFIDGYTIHDALDENGVPKENNAKYLGKKVTLSELIEWNGVIE